ncbi:MAG: DNA/RNA nuclease SfsA [Lentisphaeria bacterium]|nr:DNA/RNA nuclease SfsA [Lentisphaeria bacterium]NQZ68528.1 DNA/RNA nuclease SfsA [Lentisphaeria bacterium]
MKYPEPLIKARIIKRYKRFLADVELEDKTVITVHCPNSGSMKTCWEEGWDVRISDSKNPKRKLQYTLEMTHNGSCWICVNTQIPNKIALEAITDKRIPGLEDYDTIRTEVKYGKNSRIDLLTEKDGRKTFIEVKNVTLLGDDGNYQFPDGVSARGLKHLNELIDQVKDGQRSVMLYVINRSDGSIFKAAKDIDPDYSEGLQRAYAAGVEVICCQSRVSPEEIELTGQLIDFEIE